MVPENCVYPYNQGHFEQGRFVPDCKQCGACCCYEFARVTDEEAYKEYALFNQYHGWERIGNVIRLYNPCKMLERLDADTYRCKIHEGDRPDCCKRHGFGNYHHPPGCVFFGGNFDKEVYPEKF